MASGSHTLQFSPYMAERVECLVGVCGSNYNALGPLHTAEPCNHRQTELFGGLVNQHKQLVVSTLRNGIR